MTAVPKYFFHLTARHRRTSAIAGSMLLTMVIGSPSAWSQANDPDAVGTALEAYTRAIKPLLATRCYPCHGGLRQKAGLRLDAVSLMERGGESGAAIQPGSPDESPLMARISDPDPASRMPPEGEGEPLSSEQVAMLRQWILVGSPAPPDEQPENDPRDHWAFTPRTRPSVPTIADATGIRNPIDAFLTEARIDAGIAPQPEASRSVLARRLFIDLIGLPPSPEDLARIESDESVDWYEALVDRLLADPRHGERWGRHWMDIWRYSDWWGLGSEHRYSQKHMWHFRDWIVESLNDDLPYDEMVRHMLSADERFPEDPAKLRATGFLARNWFLFNRTPWMDETVEHVGKGLLGLTLNCAKCHDHKYDPISQEDYYRFRAFFEPIETRLDVVAGEGDLEKDGVPRVFDGHLERPTYLFVRGDDTKPDTSRAIMPGIPEVLSFGPLEVKPVLLPKAASDPVRQPWVIDAHLATARRAVESADAAVSQALEKERAARAALASAEQQARLQPSQPLPPAPTAGGIVEDFDSLDTGRWRLFGGTWTHASGRLMQGKDGHTRAAARLIPSPPADFDATFRFRITGGTTYRSVGLSFDCSQPDPVLPHSVTDNEVMVYASAWLSGPKVQAAYVSDGRWHYPVDAAITRSVEINRDHTLRVAVRDTLVNVWLDGEPVLAWRSPRPRSAGGMQVTTFDAMAIFEHISIAPLAADTSLREPTASPMTVAPSIATTRTLLATAERERISAEAMAAVQRTSLESVIRRAEAIRLSLANDPDIKAQPHADGHERTDAQQAAHAAAKSERELAVARNRQKVTEVEGRLAVASDEKKSAINKELQAARDAVIASEQAVEAAGEAFSPLIGAKWTPTRFTSSGKDDPVVSFPQTSTGRRTALAEWIVDPRNPLTARVAVNHIWNRHMGRPLVTTVFELGRKGLPPAHPKLLDWLASELIDGPPKQETGERRGWSMKHLHRLICTSAAYRMQSSIIGGEAARRTDPDNRLLWRREPIRLESQVVRDSILVLAGTLDPTMGGPPVAEADQPASRRRSIYFWHSDISRNAFLSTFDDAGVTECYERDRSIVPQQALALSNAAIVHDSSAAIASRLQSRHASMDDTLFLERAFRLILNRSPSEDERAACATAVADWRASGGDGNAAATGVGDPARVLLVWTLLNHNDFLTLR